MEVPDRHVPVLVAEVLELLGPSRGGLFVDCTLGMGGHSEALLEASPAVRVLAVDRDAESIALARERLARFGTRFETAHADFREITRLLAKRTHPAPPAGILADLGISSHQLDTAERGFAFSQDAPLDMRMDRSEGDTAADLVNGLDESELADLIYELGEERASRRIARAICREREKAPIETTRRLADIVARASGIPRHKQRIHPATKTFQALRIAVNRELEVLDRFIKDAVSALGPRGRLAVISFHSLEDRVVKQTLRALSGQCVCPVSLPVCVCGAVRSIDLLTRRPITPSDAEIQNNPRSRSAKLRAAERLG
jgi:16S rRNA (cytosine1402-N4)-methyltransferase